MTQADRIQFEKRERERAKREAQMRARNETVTDEDVIQRVKQHPVDEAGTTTEQWLILQLTDNNKQIIFPRWSVTRRGSNKQDVTFEFIQQDGRNQMQRMAYVWSVDVLDMTVGEAQLSYVGSIASAEETREQKSERRVQEFERSLE